MYGRKPGQLPYSVPAREALLENPPAYRPTCPRHEGSRPARQWAHLLPGPEGDQTTCGLPRDARVTTRSLPGYLPSEGRSQSGFPPVATTPEPRADYRSPLQIAHTRPFVPRRPTVRRSPTAGSSSHDAAHFPLVPPVSTARRRTPATSPASETGS